VSQEIYTCIETLASAHKKHKAPCCTVLFHTYTFTEWKQLLRFWVLLWADVNSVYFAPRHTTPFEFFMQKRKAKRHPAHTIASDAGRRLLHAAPHAAHRDESSRDSLSGRRYMYIRVFRHTMTIESTQHNKQRRPNSKYGHCLSCAAAAQSVYASWMRVLLFYFHFLSLILVCVCCVHVHNRADD
jgi:hypothetical protein